MRLTLSSVTVRNAIFTNDDGQVLYKTSHPFKLGTLGRTTIEKVLPNEDPLDMRDQFGVVGEIEWHLIGSSTFRLHGEELQSGQFLPSHGALGLKHTFRGPDDCPYRWDMHLSAVVLTRDDGSNTEVARYHRGPLGVVVSLAKPYLDIDASVADMLDLIILTFVYVEKLRMERERASHWGVVNI